MLFSTLLGSPGRGFLWWNRGRSLGAAVAVDLRPHRRPRECALLTQAVVSTEDAALPDRFVRADLGRSDKFRSAPWTPGCKVQLRPEMGTLGMRTYTLFA